MNWLWFSLVIIVCYLIGNVNFARVIARVFKHEDITTKGSGNPGMMNMLRNYGIGYALLTLLLESIKAGVPALVCGYIFANQGLFEVAFFTAGFSVVLGHNFPVFYKFKGGKGIACTFGMFLFSPFWWLSIVMFFVWAVFLYFVDYAFLASLGFVSSLTIAWIVKLCIVQPTLWWVALIILCVNFALDLFLHRSNFRRWFKGTENHTNFSSKVKKLFSHKEKAEQPENEAPEKEIIIEDDSSEQTTGENKQPESEVQPESESENTEKTNEENN